MALGMRHEEIAETLNAHDLGSKANCHDSFRPQLEAFNQATDNRRLDILLQAGVNLNFWDLVQGHALHHPLDQHRQEVLEVVPNHMGPEWAISILTERASDYEHGLEILGYGGWDLGCESQQEYFGPLLPGTPVKYIEEGIAAAIDQGHLEFAERLKSIVEQRNETE